LYDFAITHEQEWPSLTVEWLPKKEKNNSEDYSTHSMILGTHTSQLERNYLMIASAKLP
jgi:histone-binding protein RBBP4